MSIFSGFYGLGADVNKAGGRDLTDDTATGVMGEFLPELTLAMSDDALVKLTQKWEAKWLTSTVRSQWLKQVEQNEKYWKGEQHHRLEGNTVRPLVDNIVYQAVETYLPAATKQNPDPMVDLRATEPETDENAKYAEIIRNRLADWSDDVKLKLKLKNTGRNWLLSLVGVVKMGWDVTNSRPACKVIRPRKIIFDPDGVTDEDGYSGKYIGEYRKLEASVLKLLIKGEKNYAKSKKFIDEKTKEMDGTDFQFVEWWTPEYTCWVCEDQVFLKKKNLHWNWENTEPVLSPYQPSKKGSPVNETEGYDTNSGSDTSGPPSSISEATGGAPLSTGSNHFPSPRIPYVLLSIFNLGKTPTDETSLITQILPQQDLINKRNKQIDKNVDGMNGGVVVSEERSGLTKEEAKGATDALRRGGTIIIPAGAPGDAVMRLANPSLPGDVFNNLADTRNRVYDLFGVKGITPSGIQHDDTVHGKVLTKGLDTDRIGGGVTEYFEQFADDIYNWVYQLMLVYDPLFTNNASAKLPKIKISVKEGSLLPKDATTKANQAIELAGQGKMSLIDLYKALELPNPEEMAMNVWLEANAPEVLFKEDPRLPEAMQAMAQKAQAAQQAEGAQKIAEIQAKAAATPQKVEQPKGPSESISFKDLPPEGAAQMARQAGIHLAPQHIAAHQDQQKEARIEEKKRTMPPKPVAGSKTTSKAK